MDIWTALLDICIRSSRHVVPCASDQGRNMAEKIFQYCCYNNDYYVDEVIPLKGSGVYPCRWQVLYKFENPYRNYISDQLPLYPLRKIDLCKPEGTILGNPGLKFDIDTIRGPSYLVIYLVICDCTNDTNIFDEDVESVIFDTKKLSLES